MISIARTIRGQEEGKINLYLKDFVKNASLGFSREQSLPIRLQTFINQVNRFILIKFIKVIVSCLMMTENSFLNDLFISWFFVNIKEKELNL